MTSQSHAQRQKIVKFVEFGPLIFFYCESTCDLKDLPASIYDRKMDARPFDTIHDFLRCRSLVRSLLKGRYAPIWRKREPTYMRLLGTDWLRLDWHPLSRKIYSFPLATLLLNISAAPNQRELFRKMFSNNKPRPAYAAEQPRNK